MIPIAISCNLPVNRNINGPRIVCVNRPLMSTDKPVIITCNRMMPNKAIQILVGLMNTERYASLLHKHRNFHHKMVTTFQKLKGVQTLHQSSKI